MCKTLIVEDNVTFRQMLKESLCSRFPTMEIEEQPGGVAYVKKYGTGRLNIIRNFYEEEKHILIVNAYFLVKMEGKK